MHIDSGRWSTVTLIFTLWVATPCVSDVAEPEPAAPAASAAVQTLLDEAARLLDSGQGEAAAQASERAAVTAGNAGDGAGVARAQELRARALEHLGRPSEAMEAWRLAALMWGRLGDGPGQVAALVATAFLMMREEPAGATLRLEEALQMGRAEEKRPVAAAKVLHETAQRLEKQAEAAQSKAIAKVEVPPDLGEYRLAYRGPRLDLQRLPYARQYHEAAVALLEKSAPDSLPLAGSLSNLALAQAAMGELDLADRYLRRSLQIVEKLAPDSVKLAHILDNWGTLLARRGDLRGAKGAHERALKIIQRVAPESVDRADVLLNLAGLAADEGDLSAALALNQRALVIYERKAPDAWQIGGVLMNLGSLASARGDQRAAHDLYQRAQAILEQKAPLSVRAGLLLNLASLTSDADVAQAFYQQALAIYMRHGPATLDVARVLQAMGNVARARRQEEPATSYYGLALEIMDNVAPGSLDMASAMRDAGYFALLLERLPAAERWLQEALAIREKLAPRSVKRADTLHDLWLLAHGQGDRPRAASLAARAWHIVRDHGSQVSGGEARQAFSAAHGHFAAHLITEQVALRQYEAAFRTFEEGRAQALQQLLAERNLTARLVPGPLWQAYQQALSEQTKATAALEQAFSAELRARSELEELREQKAPESALAAQQKALTDAESATREVEAVATQTRLAVERRWAEVKRAIPRALPSPVSLAQARRALSSGTLFVGFSISEDEGTVLVVSPSTPARAFRLQVSLQQLSEQVSLLQDGVRLRQPITSQARALFQTLFPPGVRKLLPASRRIVISPDGPLWELPFALLVTNQTGPSQYLGVAKPLTYAQSLTLFVQSRRAPVSRPDRGSGTVLIVGNPLFDRAGRLQPPAEASSRITAQKTTQKPKRASADSQSLSQVIARGWGERTLLTRDDTPPPLPGAEAEARAIAQLYGGHAASGSEPTEAWFRKRAGAARLIHLATHGYFHPSRAMSSGLLLAVPEGTVGPGETDRDGALQAWEIYTQLKLRAELVVLSACETARGVNVSGEGLLGLTRALQVAGARSVVASLWKVSDTSTHAVMTRFHRELKSGTAKDEALRRAMVAVSREAKTAHPYYWAAFSLVGDPENQATRQPASARVGSIGTWGPASFTTLTCSRAAR